MLMEDMTQQKNKSEDFLSKALLLLYLNRADDKNFKVEHTKLKNDIERICSSLFEDDILIPIDFKPFGKDIYSEQLDEDILWHHSIGLIEIRRGSIIYKITAEGKKELKNPKSVYLADQQKVLKKIEESIEKVLCD